MKKGYKGFGKGLICLNKQYQENTLFEEDRAEVCKAGMHYCPNPLDVFNFYPPTNGNEFAEVESEAVPITDDNIKYCTTKLKIKGKLSIAGLVDAAVEFIKDSCKPTSGPDSNSATSGPWSNSATSGPDSNSATSGPDSNSATSGPRSNSATSGPRSNSATSGPDSNSATSGPRSNSATSGPDSNSATSGPDSNSATSGPWSNSATSGPDSNSATSGPWSNSATSGPDSNSATSGPWSNSEVSGENSIAAAIGNQSKARGSLGCWIVLAEYDDDGKIITVKSAKVTGKQIKADTWYKLENKQFVEA